MHTRLPSSKSTFTCQPAATTQNRHRIRCNCQPRMRDSRPASPFPYQRSKAMEHEHHLSKIWFKVIYHIVKVLNLQKIGLKKKKKSSTTLHISKLRKKNQCTWQTWLSTLTKDTAVIKTVQGPDKVSIIRAAQGTSREHLILSFQHSSCYATTVPLHKQVPLFFQEQLSKWQLHTNSYNYSSTNLAWQQSLKLPFEHPEIIRSGTEMLPYDIKSEHSIISNTIEWPNPMFLSSNIHDICHKPDQFTYCAIHRY